MPQPYGSSINRFGGGGGMMMMVVVVVVWNASTGFWEWIIASARKESDDGGEESKWFYSYSALCVGRPASYNKLAHTLCSLYMWRAVQFKYIFIYMMYGWWWWCWRQQLYSNRCTFVGRQCVWCVCVLIMLSKNLYVNRCSNVLNMGSTHTERERL